jgi:hypothetical protein
LQESGGGGSYVEISSDSHTESDSGFVSWDTYSPTSAVDTNYGDSGETVQIEYDEWGCKLEEGFEISAFPLMPKMCIGFTFTSNCDFTLDGDDRYRVRYLTV